jgi:hypothetical protein
MEIKQYSFPESQYFKESFPKTQIYLHHTAGNANPLSVFDGWAANPERIATCVTIGGNPGTIGKWKDGLIVQGFSSKFWAYHLGLKTATFTKANVPYKSLDKISIGIEVCNWGQLTLKNGKYYTYTNREMPLSEVTELETPYKGFKYFHKYTDAQIESVKDLLLLWKDRYKIPLTYNEDIWNITPRALRGELGVFTHNSVRTDKVDIYPCPRMIAMLKTL